MTNRCCFLCGRKSRLGDRPILDLGGENFQYWVVDIQIESQLERLEKLLDLHSANDDELRHWFQAIQARCILALLMLSESLTNNSNP